MTDRRASNSVPLQFSDDFRTGVATLVTMPIFVAPLVMAFVRGDGVDLYTMLVAACITFSGFSIVFVVCSHLLFTRTPPARVRAVAATQYHRPSPVYLRWLGGGGTISLTMSVVAGALAVAVAASVVGASERGMLLLFLVLTTVVTAWVTMVYAFALRYLRLDADGERIAFELDDEPRFSDFVLMAVMLSAMGAVTAGSPRTRAGLGAVRTHSVVAFMFNALVIAVTVSVIGGFIASAA